MVTKKTTTKPKKTIRKNTNKKSATRKISVSKSKPSSAKRAGSKTTFKKTTKSKPASKNNIKSTKGSTKRSSPKLLEKVLVCADAENCFWTKDGQVLRDLNELQTALSAMATDVYEHHVTKEKNDFADWVEWVLDDMACAEALRKSRKPNTARTVVVRHLRHYNI